MARIGIDITPLVQEQPTGVHLIASNLVETLARQYPRDQFVLTGLVPRASTTRLWQWPVWAKKNVTWALRPLPARAFHYLGNWWQRAGWPPIEVVTGIIDVYHSFDWFTFPSRAPQTATVYDLTPILLPQWHTEANRQAFERRIEAVLKRAHTVVAISRATKHDLMKLFPHYTGEVTVIYPDCAASFTAKGPTADKTILEKHCLLPGYFLAVGTIEPRKNLERVVESYRRLPPQVRHKRQLVVIGARGWETDSSWHRLKRTQGVRLLGYVPNDELPAFYRNARALLFPSLYEGFGIPILEALRCGCLVLTSSISSMPEVGGNAAFYCDPENTEDLVDRMKLIDALHTAEVTKWRRLGFAQAEQFSYTKSAEQMMGIWRRLMR